MTEPCAECPHPIGRHPMDGPCCDCECPGWVSREQADIALGYYAERIVCGEECDVPDDLVPVVENALRLIEDYRNGRSGLI